MGEESQQDEKRYDSKSRENGNQVLSRCYVQLICSKISKVRGNSMKTWKRSQVSAACWMHSFFTASQTKPFPTSTMSCSPLSGTLLLWSMNWRDYKLVTVLVQKRPFIHSTKSLYYLHFEHGTIYVRSGSCQRFLYDASIMIWFLLIVAVVVEEWSKVWKWTIMTYTTVKMDLPGYISAWSQLCS